MRSIMGKALVDITWWSIIGSLRYLERSQMKLIVVHVNLDQSQLLL